MKEVFMGIFSKIKPKITDAALMADIDEQLTDPVNYSTVVDWLVGLSTKEYEQLRQVVNIYRKANTEACKALGVKPEPSTFLAPEPAPEVQTEPEQAPAYIEEIGKRKKKVTRKK